MEWKELLKDLLSSLFKLTDYPNYKVIVVDNGSTDGSVEYVKKNFPKADILALDKNYGFSKGNNIGIRYALEKYKPKYILLLNNDTKIIQKDWLRKMVKVAESGRKIGIVGCKLLYPDGKIQHAGIDVYKFSNRGVYSPQNFFNNIEEVEAVTGACMMISKNIITKIGCLDEVYSLYLFEDMDICFRTRLKGLKIIYVGSSQIIHKESISLKKWDEMKRFYLSTRNGLILTFRYYPFSFKLKELLKCLARCFITKKYPYLPFRITNNHFHKNFVYRGFYFLKAVLVALFICGCFKTRC